MAKAMVEISIRPIGFYHGLRISKSAIPRQGHLSLQTGYIEFEKGFDHKLALTGLQEMSHVWIISFFHEAKSPAKPLVKPPRAPKLIGVYATRSPYRPNNIGLTLAQIERIEKGRLYLSRIDLLDQTPILDIKPYVTDSDQALNPHLGWIEDIESWSYSLTETAQSQARWLHNHGLTEIYDVLEAQLGTCPLQPDRKRLEQIDAQQWILSYRTWRLHLVIDQEKLHSEVVKIESGYTKQELEDPRDPYQDKDLHRNYKNYNNGN